jgi:hypothetical protein
MWVAWQGRPTAASVRGEKQIEQSTSSEADGIVIGTSPVERNVLRADGIVELTIE